MDVNCSEEKDLDEFTLCDLTGNNLVVVAKEDELQQAEASVEVDKGWTKYSAKIDQVSTNKVRSKTPPNDKESFLKGLCWRFFLCFPPWSML